MQKIASKIPRLGRFNNLAGLQAGGADAHALVGAVHPGAHRTQVHVPAAAAHVVGVADLVSKLRAFAADITNLCHLNDSQMSDAEGLYGLQVVVVKGKFYRKIEGLANGSTRNRKQKPKPTTEARRRGENQETYRGSPRMTRI